MFVYELEPEPKQIFTALQHCQQASVISTSFWRDINSLSLPTRSLSPSPWVSISWVMNYPDRFASYIMWPNIRPCSILDTESMAACSLSGSHLLLSAWTCQFRFFQSEICVTKAMSCLSLLSTKVWRPSSGALFSVGCSYFEDHHWHWLTLTDTGPHCKIYSSGTKNS